MKGKGIVRFYVCFACSIILVLFLGGCSLFQGAGQVPAISVDPSSGPTGTSATIKITGAEPGQSVTIQIGQGSVNGTIDQNGELNYDHPFSGQVGDVIIITAVIGNANEYTVSTSFTITAPPERVFSDVNDDSLQAEGNGAKINVSPGQGPTGTRVLITIRDAKPNQPVTLKHSGGSTNYNTDENGVLVVEDTMVGRVGDVIQIEATIGNFNEEHVSTTFTITAPSEDISEEGQNPLQAKGEEPEISVNPNKGPSGTRAQIIIRGAEPNQPVTIRHSGGSTNATTDENGVCVVDDTFYGRVGDVIQIEATIGAANEHQVTTTFEITAPLEQTFLCATTVDQDPAGHQPFVEMPEENLMLKVREGSLIIEGPHPWVNVTGELNEDGNFTANGSGEVAGFSDISVGFEGTVSMQHLEGKYTMGVEGGLPSGQPITYIVQGRPEVDTTAGGSEEDVVKFFEDFNQAQQTGDTEGMLAMLHPSVLAKYGQQACQAYLESVVNPSVEIEVLGVNAFGFWLWELDGSRTYIEDTYSVDVNVHSEQGVTQQEIHIAVDQDGMLGWFTDCGDPLE
jgi:hypothetical protein